MTAKPTMTMKTNNYHEMQSVARSYRRTGATAITHSGGKRTVFGCLCGARHTTSTDWNGRNARHVVEWREQHEGDCARLFQRLVARKSDGWLARQRDATYSNDIH